MTGDEAVSHAVRASRDRPTRRLMVACAVGGVLGVVVTVVAVWLGWRASQDQADAGVSLADQVSAACASGDIEPAAAELCDKATVVQEQAETGPAGPPGLPGVGVPGPRGEPGTDSTVPGPRGEQGVPGRAGQDGQAGRDGVDGVDGADSVVPGPQGEPGADSTVPGPPGPTGPPGADGNDGADGADGQDGVDARPFEFEFTIPADTPAGRDRTYRVVCETVGSPCTVTETDPGPTVDSGP